MISALLATMFGPGLAWACEDGTSCDAHTANPGSCAKVAELVGPGNCSWTTAMLADRVLDEGAPYAFVGRMSASTNKLASRVAAPFTIGPTNEIHVVANEVVDLMHRQGATEGRVELRGSVLEVDGIKYLVVAEFSAPQS